MSNTFKKLVSYILIGLVLMVTIVAVLAIWDVIKIESDRLFNNIILSLLAIFVSSLVVLFISSNFLKDNNKKQ
ncbi:MAG: hypothetical protein A2W91_19190 [Bacteroidetes bacterium GWF2_38_335]|nr:MAG: hypothetical protein A2W91_19190 [Bacteroidetes bacterium GWF2_38_335]OFY79885.1 MAG: hypothetical protein A2281_10590 [Bacteroidetes bacterium RIFOXYA12_FULL_38_20]HBS86340.1 hypothetical protein [Bacteroidales bacterium]